MMEFMPEGLGLKIDELTQQQIDCAINNETILESTALAFDHNRQLRFEIDGNIFYMPYEECADGVECDNFRDISLLTRVGHSTCFILKRTGNSLCLSRKEAQKKCKLKYLNSLIEGDTLKCVVTHLESFGAFCDVGCGIISLMPIDCMSVSRIQHPKDRVSVGQQLNCVLKSRDNQGRFVLSLKELMGTWAQNAAQFKVGETVVGIVRSIEEYGVFIELAPNLAGLAEPNHNVVPGQTVSVYIKSIIPEKMKIKLSIINTAIGEQIYFGPKYFLTDKHLSAWNYSPCLCHKQIATVFDSEGIDL